MCQGSDRILRSSPQSVIIDILKETLEDVAIPHTVAPERVDGLSAFAPVLDWNKFRVEGKYTESVYRQLASSTASRKMIAKPCLNG
jgi:hypothetical protein